VESGEGIRCPVCLRMVCVEPCLDGERLRVGEHRRRDGAQRDGSAFGWCEFSGVVVGPLLEGLLVVGALERDASHARRGEKARAREVG